MTIFTLNLWRQYEWKTRKPKIVEFLKENLPDVICLQEVQICPNGLSQAEELQQVLSEYQFCIHSTIYPKISEKGKLLPTSKQHGMAVLSKYPVTNSLTYFVPQQKDEKEPRSVLLFDILKNSEIYKFVNVHLGNKTEWATPQMANLLEFLEKRNEQRILCGDFNLFELPKLANYHSSFDYQNYKSHKDWTLDYVLLPSNYNFKNLQLVENLSDHSGLLIEIETQI